MTASLSDKPAHTADKLRKGQVAFRNLQPELLTAHDVRKLRPCVYCGDIGSAGSMIDTSPTQWWHGRCFVKKFGADRMLQLDNKILSRLMLGDLGVELMKTVLARAAIARATGAA